MEITIVTTQNKKYYDDIGKYCIQSFLKHWPGNSKMILYAEHFVPEETHNRLVINPMDDVLLSWQEYTQHFPLPYRKKVSKFWLKSFVLIDALEKADNTVIWLDSDVVTYKDIPHSFFENLLPQKYLLCDLPCGGPLHNLESETGFCMINTKHSGFKRFLKNYKSYYKDHNLMLNLPRPVDGAVWWQARTISQQHGDLVHGISSKTNTVAPWWNSILAEYLLHWIKGKGKTRFKNHHGLS